MKAQLPLENSFAIASEHHQRGVQAGRRGTAFQKCPKELPKLRVVRQRGRDPRDQIEELEEILACLAILFRSWQSCHLRRMPTSSSPELAASTTIGLGGFDSLDMSRHLR